LVRISTVRRKSIQSPVPTRQVVSASPAEKKTSAARDGLELLEIKPSSCGVSSLSPTSRIGARIRAGILIWRENGSRGLHYRSAILAGVGGGYLGAEIFGGGWSGRESLS
jgi:hypothetical protein